MSIDQDSRLKTTTVTNFPEYYDQVLALSSKMINDSWVTLYNDNDVLHSIDVDGYKHSRNKGQITGKLKPCQFYIKQDEFNGIQAYYKIRFESGILETSGHDALKMPVDNWEIAINVGLNRQEWRKMTDDQKKSITKYYELPDPQGDSGGAGDYSVSRIFATIINAKINQVDEDESVFTDENGNPCKFDDFDGPTQDALGAFLDAWTEIQHGQGTNTLGVTLTNPSDKEENPLEPTYRPRKVWMNCSDYPNQQAAAVDKKNYRCLLWCELLPGHDDLDDPVIATRASWCYPGIDATYAVSSRVFFEKFLVPQLQLLARASELKPTDTILDDIFPHNTDPIGYGIAYWKFGIGYNKDHTAADDDYFKLTAVEGKPPKYTWSKKNIGDTGVKYMVFNPNDRDSSGWANLFQTGTAELTVSPNVGTNKISVSGTIKYNWNFRFSDDQNVMDTSPAASAHYSGNWDLSLLLSTDEDGQLLLKIDGDIDPQVKLDSHVGGLWNTGEWDNDIKELLRMQLSDSVTAAEANLTNLFQTTGKFVYPSNGLLSFTDPIFNEEGDILAAVEYKPMTAVTVPSPSAGPKLATYAASVDKSLGNQFPPSE